MKKTLFVLLLFTGLLCAQNFKKIKVFNAGPEAISLVNKLGVDHIHKERDGSFDFFISDDLYEQFQDLGLSYDVEIDDWYKYYKNRSESSAAELQAQLNKTKNTFNVTGFDYGSMGGFYTLDEVMVKLDEMKSEFPSLITEKSSIGTTHDGRDIYFVKISNNPDMDEDEPEILYTALHHAREPESMMQMIYYMFYLLENYGTDPKVTYLVDNREMYFIPVVNPDGYEYNHQTNPNGGGFWRKNRRDNGDGTYGVDLNRNYGPVEYWDSPNGGSDDNTSSDVYRGLEPFSEPETEAVKNFLAQHKFKAALNYHTYGNLLIYPYGALAMETPDSLIFREFAKDMTKYNGYTYGTDMQTVNYTTRGNSDDYFYDGDVEEKGKILAMTPEVGPEFWPSQSQIIPLAEENLFPNLYFAWVIGGYVGPSNVSFNQDFYNPGDTILVSVDFRNKGLEDFGEFNAKLTSNTDMIKVLQGDYSGSTIPARSEIEKENLFAFFVSNDAVEGSIVEVSVSTSMGEVSLLEETLSFRIGTPKVLYTDHFADFSSTWSSTSNVSEAWQTTNLSFYSEPVSVTDSKYGDYMSSARVTLQLKEPVSLVGLSKPMLTFRTRFEIETGWDYGQCLVSADSGSSWYAVPGEYTTTGEGQFQPAGEPVYSGTVSDWVLEQINLEPFAGSDILIKFVLKSDEYVELDGWYIDDLQILYYGDRFTAIVDDTVVPTEFTLEQNYPNPFNPATTIEYTVSSGRVISRSETTRNLKDSAADETGVQNDNISVNLVIYDILGREVATLVNQNQKPGRYTVEFDASDLSSGLYLYRLTAGEFTSVRKMLLMK